MGEDIHLSFKTDFTVNSLCSTVFSGSKEATTARGVHIELELVSIEVQQLCSTAKMLAK